MLKVFKKDSMQLSTKVVGEDILFGADSVGKALGITTVAKSGNECVRWSRLNEYLGSPAVAIRRGDYITEPQLYMLTFKANNEAALAFQMWVATEVLPAIRTQGAYVSNNITPAQETALTKYGTNIARRKLILNTPIETLDEEIENCMKYHRRKTAKDKVTMRMHMGRLIEERQGLASSTAQKLWLEEVKVKVVKKMGTTKAKSYAAQLTKANNKIAETKKTISDLNTTLGQAKEYCDELEEYCEELYPSSKDFSSLNYHPFSVNSMYVLGIKGKKRSNAYNNWINNFPDAKWDRLEADKYYAIYMQVECLQEFDTDNLSKSFVDQIVRDTGCDDKNFV